MYAGANYPRGPSRVRWRYISRKKDTNTEKLLKDVLFHFIL